MDDDVWILLATESRKWGLFLFEARKSASPRVVELDVNDPGKGGGCGRAQGMGVEVAPPGDHETACGKGYWDCRPGEPNVLHLVHPGISYFQLEGTRSIFWWEGKSRSFKRTWISD